MSSDFLTLEAHPAKILRPQKVHFTLDGQSTNPKTTINGATKKRSTNTTSKLALQGLTIRE
jgi:hypothetical protein